MTMIFETFRAALLFVAIGLMFRQIAEYQGARNWIWWFISLTLCGFIASFLIPVLDHMQPAFLLASGVQAMAPMSAVIGIVLVYSALVCLQVHIAGGLRNWAEVLIFNLFLLAAIGTIEYFL